MPAAKLAKKRYGASRSADDVSLRVIADHARTTAFLIADGVVPDRTGREYVLRRVMRRAIRHGHRLGIEEPFLHEVAGAVVETMGEAYPELRERSALQLRLSEAQSLASIEQRAREMQMHPMDPQQARYLTIEPPAEEPVTGAEEPVAGADNQEPMTR